MSIIEIFNQNAVPYGPLSNNSKSIMTINKEKWTSVTQYIYTNMLTSFLYQDKIKNIPLKDIHKTFLEFQKKEIEGIIAEGLNEAFNVKFQNPNMLKILLSTNDSKIVYVSDNEFLGNGLNNTGSNVLGKYLVQIRDQIKNTKIKEEEKINRQNKIYEAFVMYKFLETQITQEGNDLSGYLYSVKEFNTNLVNSFEDIINIYSKNRPGAKSKIVQTLNNKENKRFFFETYKDDKLMTLLEISLKNPSYIILYLRKLYLSKLRSNQEFIKNNNIFKMYLEYMIKTNFPEIKKEEYNKAINQQLSKISGEEQDKIKKTITENIKNLPAPLYNDIKTFLSTLKMPSKEEIMIAEKFEINDIDINVDIDDKEKVKDKDKIIEIYEGNPSINYKDDLILFKSNSVQLLSPVYYTGMLRIKDLDYPTVTHYILGCLFANLPNIGNLKNAHKYLLKDPSGQIWDPNIPFNWIYYKFLTNRYFDISLQEEDNNMRKLGIIGIDKKFEDIKMQNLLMSTNNSRLIYKDFNNTILGVGRDNKGENFVGNYLMEIRNNIEGIQVIEKNRIINIGNISDIIENDIFINQWVIKRIKDMINMVRKFKFYSERKYNINIQISFALFSNVLDQIYKVCNKKIPDDIIITIPSSVINEVRDELKGKYSSGILNLLWERIVIMLYFLINSIKNPTVYYIKNSILKYESLVSKETNCIIVIKDNNRLNCILSAIINVLISIVKYNTNSYLYLEGKGAIYNPERKKYTTVENFIDPRVTKYDIELATHIILNKPISQINTKNNYFEDKEKEVDDIAKVYNIEHEEKNIDFEKDEEEIANLYQDDADDEENIEDFDYPDDDDDEENIEDFDYPDDDEEDKNDQEDYGDYDGVDTPLNDYNLQKREREMMGLEDILNIKNNNIFNDLYNYIFDKKVFGKQTQDIIIDIEDTEEEKLKKRNLNDENESKQYTNITEYNLEGAKFIEKYKIPKKIKTNRINFFATLR